jgi:CheY-like chemotaxis protein
VESTQGRGSRFWFRIPARAVDELSADGGKSSQVQSPHRGRILLVEDNAVNRAVVKAMIERLGLQVSLAEDGQQAVDLITSGHTYDVVLMDIRMPVMDGLEATRQIRHWEAAHQHQPVRIIALTASHDKNERQQCTTAGMNDCLSKPVDIHEFKQVFAHLLP